MTWDQLADCINNMSPDQRETDVTIYDGTQCEFHPVIEGLKFSKPENDVLDPGHPFVIILT